MSDLTEEQLLDIDQWAASDLDPKSGAELHSLTDEIRRHRSAVAADEERVRSVVGEAVLAQSGGGGHVHWPYIADAIAARAAKQLATTTVRLTADEREALLAVRRLIVATAKSCNDQKPYVSQIALLDRLLATGSAP